MPDATGFRENGNAASPLHFAAHHRKTAVRSPTPVPKTAAGGRPLLVGLPPSTPTIAPTEPKRSTPTPCSWGGCASNPSQRRWPAALPPPCSWGGRAVLRASSRCKGKGRGGSLRRCLAPLGQGALPVCGVDAVCPCGAKALQSGAPDLGWFMGKSILWGALPIRGAFPARRGTESGQPFMQTAFPNRRRRQVPARGLAAVCMHSRPKRNESQTVCPLLVGQAGVNFEPTALAAGTAGPAGSARTRSRVQTLENPFLGNRPRLPCPLNRRLLPPPPQSERNKAPKPPTRGAWARLPRANGYWPPALPAYSDT